MSLDGIISYYCTGKKIELNVQLKEKSVTASSV